MDRTLAAIVNSYNRLGLLKKALPSLVGGLRHTSVGSSIIIYDAGSTDGSVPYIKRMKKKTDVPIHLIEPDKDEDRSFSAGVNRAVNYAASTYPGLEWCLLYETDNCVKNYFAIDCAIELLARDQKLAATGFTVEDRDGRKVGFGEPFPSVLTFVLGLRISSWFGLSDPKPKWMKENGIRFAHCDVVYTSPLLIRYKYWREVAGMDSEMFPFSDSDIDLCWRFAKRGYQVAVIDTQGVIHDNEEKASEWSAERIYTLHRGRFRLLRRHVGEGVRLVKPILFLRHLGQVLYVFILYAAGKRSWSSVKQRLRLCIGVLFSYEY